MQFSTISLSLAALSGFVAAQESEPRCTGGPNAFAFCETGSLKTNIIGRCQGVGMASFGNCNDNIDAYPTECYEDSPTAGNAQCVKDCSTVMTLNGTVFYPLGCSTSGIPAGALASQSNSTSTASSPSATHSVTAPKFTSGANKDVLATGSLSSLLVAVVGLMIMS